MSGNYYVPSSSKWPILTAIAALIFFFGLVLKIHGTNSFLIYIGIALILYLMFRWFKDVVIESIAGKYRTQEDMSFRMGMAWFIFSEVTFFACFFGSLFYVRVFALPWIGGEGDGLFTNQYLYPEFSASWPLISFPVDKTLLGAGAVSFSAPTQLVSAWGIPAMNTLILLTSGLTLTLAHYALIMGKRKELLMQLAITIALGLIFLGFQVYEYMYAYSLGLTLKTGIYGSLFYMLTGFHGFHVFVGASILLAMFFRVKRGHFSAEHHFAFSAAAWYWHFVDVVWLGLFVVVYWI